MIINANTMGKWQFTPKFAQFTLILQRESPALMVVVCHSHTQVPLHPSATARYVSIH